MADRVRFLTMKTMAISPLVCPVCCRFCQYQAFIADPESSEPVDVIFMAVYMYPTEVFGVMPKEAKDAINALIKVAEEDKLGIDLVLLVPDIPPPIKPKTFWERLKEKLLAICGGEEWKSHT